MIIGIQKGLDYIKKGLEQRGYKVIYADKYLAHIDAYIYSSNKVEGIFENVMLDTTQHYLNNINSSSGIIMINANGNTLQRIITMLNNRCYSSLNLM